MNKKEKNLDEFNFHSNQLNNFENYVLEQMFRLEFNTFASQRFFFEGKNEPFLLENTSHSTHEFFMTKFLLKLSYKNSCVKFDGFSRQNGHFFY